jgi:hypothetical protein
MFKTLVKMGLLTLVLAVGACSSNSNGNPGTGGAQGSGGTTGTGGTTATGGASGTGGMAPDGGADSGDMPGTGGMSGTGGAGGGTPMTISDCGKLATPQAINNCIINLPTTSVAQTVTTPTTPTFNSCKM